jgi:cystathionine beta-lyase
MSKKDTRYMEAGRKKAWTQGIVNPPVYHASTIVFDTVADMRAAGKAPHEIMSYGRRGTPTSFALCDALTELSGGAGTVLYPSGLAAVAGAVLSFAKAGGRVLISDSVYEPTRAFANQVLKNYGVEVVYYDPQIGAGIAALLDDNTQVVVLESPGSVTMEVQDVSAIAKAAHDAGAVVILDNTWATPYFFNAFDHGVDVEVQALTKYIMGHSDGLLGSATANARTIDRLRQMSGALGTHGAPDDVARALKGLRTLPVRLKHHQESALHIAQWLQGHDHVAEVRYPALPGSLGHDLWKRDFSGASGLLSMVMTEDNDAALTAFVEGMRYFKLGFSWGGYESLVMFYRHIARLRTATGWNKGAVIRLHIGLEDVDDLKADIEAAFARYKAAL